jgi:hypothetical protein
MMGDTGVQLVVVSVRGLDFPDSPGPVEGGPKEEYDRAIVT